MKIINPNLIGLALPTLLLFSISACGYQMAGRGDHLSIGIKTIAIPVFENRTMEPIIEEELTPAVIEEFIKDSRIEVVDSSKADAILRGSVISYKESPLSFDKKNVLEYRITVTTHLRLIKHTPPPLNPHPALPHKGGGEKEGTIRTLPQGEGEILWEKDINTSAEYSVSGDVMSTKVSKLLALREIARNLAEEVTDRVLWGW